MNTLDQALAYAASGLPVFPCDESKKPLTRHGFHEASRDNPVITRWFRRCPNALIGMPTGSASGRNVLDVDVKHPPVSGFDTLADLGWPILPTTPIAHSPSGGVHLHFRADVEIRNTIGERGRGLGPGLDWRATGGFIILPSSKSGYRWDPACGPNTPLAPIPAGLLPREPAAPKPTAAPIPPGGDGLTPYAEAALDDAARRIIAAPCGEQEATINSQSFSIGTLAGAGGIPESFALDVLLWATQQVPNYDPRNPWRPSDLEAKVKRAFADGTRHPRRMRCA